MMELLISEDDFIVRNYNVISETEVECDLAFHPDFDVKEFFNISKEDWKKNRDYEIYGSIVADPTAGRIKIEGELSDGTVYFNEYSSDDPLYHLFFDLTTQAVMIESDRFGTIQAAVQDYNESHPENK